MPYELRGSDTGHKSCFRLPVFGTPTPFQRAVHAPPHLLSVLTRRLQRPRRRPGRTMVGFNHWRLRFVHTSDMCVGLQHCNLLPMSPLAPKQATCHTNSEAATQATNIASGRQCSGHPHLSKELSMHLHIFSRSSLSRPSFLQGPPDCVFASAGMRRSAGTRASMAGR